jgi:virginiamycin B lyase
MRLRVGVLCLPVLAALAACGGSTSSSPTPPTPAASTTPNSVASAASSTSTSVNVGSAPETATLGTISTGYSGSVTFPAASSGSGAVTVVLQSTLPANAPAVQSSARRPEAIGGTLTTLAVITMLPVVTFTLPTTPAFTITFPPGLNLTAGTNLYVGFYDPADPSAGWQTFAGPGTVTGSTTVFRATPGSRTFMAGTTYVFVLFSTTQSLAPTASPSASASPSSSPSATPSAGASSAPTASATPTPGASATPTLVPSVTPTPTPTPVSTPSGVPTASPTATASASVSPTLAITEFPLAAGLTPGTITTGPDGALWFTDAPETTGAGGPTLSGGQIGRITTGGSITEYTLPSGSIAGDITVGPDGALWFTEGVFAKIGRITTTGSITEYPTPGLTYRIAAGPDGALWFTESTNPSFVNSGAGEIGRITTSGTVTQYSLPTGNSISGGWIAAGPDGALWFLDGNSTNQEIGRATTSGSFTEYALTLGSGYSGGVGDGITFGPDGALWLAISSYPANLVGRMTTAGSFSQFTVPGVYYNSLNDITVGADGALWFDSSGDYGTAGAIGRMTTSGTATVYAPFSASSIPMSITSGPDGNLWFCDYGTNSIGRVSI